MWFSFLFGLFFVVQCNVDWGFGDVGLFEVGQVFFGDILDGQIMVVVGIWCGIVKMFGGGCYWFGLVIDVDVFDVKVDVEVVLVVIGVLVEKL